MDTAVGNQSKQMEAMTTRTRKGFLQYPIALQLTFRDRIVDAGQVLVNDPARSQIEMANFRVAHLSFGQSDVGPARAQFGVRIFLIKPVVKRRPGEKRGVAILFAFLPTPAINAPAITNNEHDRARHIRRTLPVIGKIDKSQVSGLTTHRPRAYIAS